MCVTPKTRERTIATGALPAIACCKTATTIDGFVGASLALAVREQASRLYAKQTGEFAREPARKCNGRGTCVP